MKDIKDAIAGVWSIIYGCCIAAVGCVFLANLASLVLGGLLLGFLPL